MSLWNPSRSERLDALVKIGLSSPDPLMRAAIHGSGADARRTIDAIVAEAARIDIWRIDKRRYRDDPEARRLLDDARAACLALADHLTRTNDERLMRTGRKRGVS